jgi:hypothetical protein
MRVKLNGTSKIYCNKPLPFATRSCPTPTSTLSDRVLMELQTMTSLSLKIGILKNNQI